MCRFWTDSLHCECSESVAQLCVFFQYDLNLSVMYAVYMYIMQIAEAEGNRGNKYFRESCRVDLKLEKKRLLPGPEWHPKE